jgi:hypothetical protein
VVQVAHIATHRAGLPHAGTPDLVGDPLVVRDWQGMLRRMEEARPETAPGAQQVYHCESHREQPRQACVLGGGPLGDESSVPEVLLLQPPSNPQIAVLLVVLLSRCSLATQGLLRYTKESMDVSY